MECSSGGAFVIKLIVVALVLPSSFGFFPRYRNYPGGLAEEDNELANQIMQSRIKSQILKLPLELFEQRQLVQEHVDYENSVAQYKHMENEEVLHEVPFNGNHQDVLIVGNPFRKPDVVKNVLVLRRIPGTSLFYLTSVTVRQNPNDDNKGYEVRLRKVRSKRSTTNDVPRSNSSQDESWESDENVDKAAAHYEIAKAAAKAASDAAAAALKAAADAEAAYLAANGGRRRKIRKGNGTDEGGAMGRALDGTESDEDDANSSMLLGRVLTLSGTGGDDDDLISGEEGESSGPKGRTLTGVVTGGVDDNSSGPMGRTLTGIGKGGGDDDDLISGEEGESSGPKGRTLTGVGTGGVDDNSSGPMGRTLTGVGTGGADSEEGIPKGRTLDEDDVAPEDLKADKSSKNKKPSGTNAPGNPKDPGTLELIYGKSSDPASITLTVVPPQIDTAEIDAAGQDRLTEVNQASTKTDLKNAIALAKGVEKNVTANAVSLTGDDAIALAMNGSSADALALTKSGAGNAFSGATTHGEDGAKSAALNQGSGTSVSSAMSKGAGSAKSDALALESNATSGAVAGSGGANSNAITHKEGHALSQASTTEGGSGKASSIATGVGEARSGAQAVGGGNATAISKSKDGNAEADTVSKGGASYSASWAKDLGSSFSNAVTYGAKGTRAESLSDGVGTAVAKAYQINAPEESDGDRHLDMDEVVDGFGIHNGDDFMNDPFFRGRTEGGVPIRDLAGQGDDEISKHLPGGWNQDYDSDVKVRKKRDADVDDDDYEVEPPSPPSPPSSIKLDDTETQAVSTKSNNPKGELVSNAHSKHGQSLSIAISKMGASATSTAVNGTGAIAVTKTKGRGAASSRANSHGKEGARSQSLTTGRGNASSHAVAQGQVGGSQTEAIAVGGNANADSTSVRGTNALSSAQTLKTGDATSKSIALLGGNSSAASVAKGQGNAKSNSWADDRGHSSSISKAKGGNSTANSVGLRDSHSYSVASSQKNGSSLGYALTGIRGTSRADAMTDAGNAVAVTVQDSPHDTINIKDFMQKQEFRDFGSSEEVNVQEEDSEEPDTVSSAARKKRHAPGRTHSQVM